LEEGTAAGGAFVRIVASISEGRSLEARDQGKTSKEEIKGKRSRDDGQG
jgi:hypothetical protein